MFDDRNIKNLVLIGFMGTGKTTVGRLLAAQLHHAFVDTDHLIETSAGKSVAEIFSSAGESTFRDMEHQVVLELAKRQDHVIATGGGLVCFKDNLTLLKEYAMVVCLWASPEVIFERVRHHDHRPLLHAPDPLRKIQSLLADREPYYRQADLLISTDGRPIREIAQHILHEYCAVKRQHHVA